MRLVAGVLALTLFAPLARAEDARTPEPAGWAEDATHGKVPLRIVRVMPESHQALLFDRARATHVLAEVGREIDGYTVESIEEDEVTLRFEGKQIVLAAPVRRGNRRRDREVPAVHVRSAGPGATQADMAAGDPTPLDPYADPPIRVVEAPGRVPRDPVGSAARAIGGGIEVGIEAGEGGVRVAEAPGSTAVAPGVAPGITGARAGARIASVPAGQDGIRVAEAPTAASGGPPASEARMAEARTPDAKAPDVKTSDVRAVDAVRAPDKQTLDARALADVMSADTRPRGVRTPASGSSSTATPAVTADRHPVAPAAAPAQPASEVRTTSAVRTASAASSEAVVLARADVDGALADFARLAAALHGRFSADGLVIDDVKDGTIFQRAGLRAGDVVTSVDGAPLRSLDDAANLYARASSTQGITAQVVRSGKPMTLRVAIQ